MGSCPGSARARRSAAFLVVVGLVVAGGSAGAQERFDVQQFNPTVSQFTGFFSQPSGRVLEAGRWELGLLFNYADDPLVLYDDDNNRVASVVSGQLSANIMAVFGIAGLLDIGLDIPLVLYQGGDEVTDLPGLEASGAGFGVGDIRIVPRFMLVGPRDRTTFEGVALGLLLDTRLPTGSRDDYQGEPFRIEPKLAFDVGLPNGIRLGASLGYMIRTGDTQLANVEVDDSLTWSVAAAFPVTNSLHIVPELFGEWMLLAEEVNAEELPLEVLLGLKWWAAPSILVQVGGGAGLVRGIGSPDFRLFLGLAFSPERPRDRDGDGIEDRFDACPDEPEDFDGFEDHDGCPEPGDAQGLLELDPEAEGRLELDPEAEGRLHADSDGDGILDIDDLCPDEPEDFNGFQDEDGCPDEVIVSCVAIEISDRVHFETDSDVILPRSLGMLSEVARVLQEATWIHRIRVEGHTDSRASAEYNLDLSQRRAASVMRYLVERGVDPRRLEARGYGLSRPIADNETEEGRALNRRVEFTILEQEGCPVQPTGE
jgi:outer membrane protein OmpA-like peptidoglycan-associated protein